ncbi:MAG: hypothetical protein RLZZ505_171 [Verrucomicrobiota bacterium]|jgi:hypothetical protein
MPRKIIKTESQRAASRKGLKRINRPKGNRSHSWPFFLLGSAFLIMGTLQALDPIPYQSGGGYAKGAGGPDIIYSPSQSAGLGVFMALTGLIILYFGYRILMNARRR